VIKTVQWIGDTNGHAKVVEQTLLPNTFEYIDIKTTQQMYHAIKTLQVRGAPAIGVAAAYGIVIGLNNVNDNDTVDAALANISATVDYLSESRPTAVNLFWALNRMQMKAQQLSCYNALDVKQLLLAEANNICAEDIEMSKAMGRHGAPLIKPSDGVLTHCNAGGMATAGYGTALAILFTAHENGTPFFVYVDETRPLLQGARITSWELKQAGIDVTLNCDNMAGHMMKLGKINLVITGADRIAANGDAANKIGTYSLAILAKHHQIPFYIAAPSTTFDLSLTTGDEIPIEERDPSEITQPDVNGRLWAPKDINVFNPAFDVTPASLITGIITELGIIAQPTTEGIVNHFKP
jgi:methylthioribose-1-phosphate isomerase